MFLWYLGICFCLKRARPWLEFRIRFNQYSLRSLQRVLLGFNSFWIHFILRGFYWVPMSKIFNTPLQMESWARCLGGRIFFPFQKKSYILFSNYFLIYFTTVWVRGFGLRLSFYLSKEFYFVPDMDFFIIPLLMLSQLELIRIELPKLTPIILMENCDHFIFPDWSILFLYPSSDNA